MTRFRKVTVALVEGAVLWDLDGTIADTADLHFLSWQEVLGEIGVAHTRAEFERGFGRSNPSILAELLPDRSVAEHQRIATRKEDAFRQSLHGAVKLLPGVTAWMDVFRGWRDAGGLFFGADGEYLVHGDAVGRGRLLPLVGVGRACAARKPAPDLFCAGRLWRARSPVTCLVIEDSLHGVEAAAAAGMRCVVVGRWRGSMRRWPVCSRGPNTLWRWKICRSVDWVKRSRGCAGEFGRR
ncbi:MAG: HAD hydrolase-like protein [Caldilineaceae bacterium]